MKTLKTLSLCVLLGLCFCSTRAQQPPSFREPNYNLPKLFAGLPETITVDPQYLFDFSTKPVGGAVTIRIGASNLDGVISSKSDPADLSVQSFVVRSTNFNGALLTFSRVVDKDGKQFYRGRIISRQHSDAYELVAADDGYRFVKKHQLRILSE